MTLESLEKAARIIVEQAIAIRQIEIQKEVLSKHP